MVDSNKTTTKLNRRKLFSMISAESSTNLVPAELAPPEAQAQEIVEAELNEEQRGYLEQVRSLEAELAVNKDAFSWKTHNELRHYYLAFNREKSLAHSDIILSHHMMDDYILNTLSDWHFTHGRPEEGIAVLLNLVENHGNFEHITAACLIKIGDASRKHDIGDPAEPYSKAVELTEDRNKVVPSLKQYYYLAKLRLGKL